MFLYGKKLLPELRLKFKGGRAGRATRQARKYGYGGIRKVS